MGTDIHGSLRTKTWRDKWEYHSLPEYFDCRDYDFFAILANVRNGYGFAGTPRYKVPIVPFTDGRGLPLDLIDLPRNELPNGQWIGEHSIGYITLAELKRDLHLAEQAVIRTGIVTLEHYLGLNGSSPTSWSGGVGGPSIVVSNEDSITNETTHVHMSWNDQPFLEKIQKLVCWMELYQGWKDETGADVQLIFGFDS